MTPNTGLDEILTFAALPQHKVESVKPFQGLGSFCLDFQGGAALTPGYWV